MGMNQIDLLFTNELLDEGDILPPLSNIPLSDRMPDHRGIRLGIEIVRKDVHCVSVRDLCIRERRGKRFRAGHFELREDL